MIETRPVVREEIPCAHPNPRMYILRLGKRVCLDCAADWYVATGDPRVQHVWLMASQERRRLRTASEARRMLS